MTIRVRSPANLPQAIAIWQSCREDVDPSGGAYLPALSDVIVMLENTPDTMP